MAIKVMTYSQEKAMGAEHSYILCAIVFTLSMNDKTTSVEKVKISVYMLA